MGLINTPSLYMNVLVIYCLVQKHKPLFRTQMSKFTLQICNCQQETRLT